MTLLLRKTLCASVLLGCAATGAGAAKPVEVGFSTAGEPGNWTLSFWIKGNASDKPVRLRVAAFGLRLPEGSVIVAPAGFDVDRYQLWYHAGAGGSAVQYNRTWASMSTPALSKTPMNGFIVQLDAQAPPDAVPWFVLTKSTEAQGYQGKDFFGASNEPGFEGLALSVPEPATYGLLGMGLACIAVARLRACRAAASTDAD